MIPKRARLFLPLGRTGSPVGVSLNLVLSPTAGPANVPAGTSVTFVTFVTFVTA